MEIKDLPIGTKLMWDAPIPFEGYYNENKDYPGRIVYPCTLGKRHHLKGEPQDSMRMVHGPKTINKNWMRAIEYLRYPTEEELLKFEWPDYEL
jgi:hypothetical protein